MYYIKIITIFNYPIFNKYNAKIDTIFNYPTFNNNFYTKNVTIFN